MAITQDNYTSEEVAPLGSAYFKPVTGANKIRLISSMVAGYECWFEDSEGKPSVLRRKVKFSPEEVEAAKDRKQRVFWACVVFNYETKQAEEWIFGQKSIMNSLKTLAANPAWGPNLKSFDINLFKSGAALTTEYSITPDPKTPMSFLADYENFEENLQNVFIGEPLFTNDPKPAVEGSEEAVF